MAFNLNFRIASTLAAAAVSTAVITGASHAGALPPDLNFSLQVNNEKPNSVLPERHADWSDDVELHGRL